MSDDASRARNVGPFVKIVASATWLFAIDGFFCSESSTSTCVCSASCLSSFAELSLGVLAHRRGELHVPALHLKSHRRLLAWWSNLILAALAHGVRAKVTTSTARLRRRARRPSPPRRPSRRSCRRRRRAAPSGTRPLVAPKAPRTFARRRGRASPAWRAARRPPRPRSGADLEPPRAPSSQRRARSAGWWPRRSCRPPSGGIYVMTSAAGRAARSTTSSAARSAARRRPCSFHARRSGRAGPAYGDRSARRGEREPTARALAAARDRPGGRCAAAGAPRRTSRAEQTSDTAAQTPRPKRRRRRSAREEHVEEPRRRRYGQTVRRVCAGFVPNVCYESGEYVARGRAARAARGAGCRLRAAARGCRCRTTRRRTASRRRARRC